MSEAKESEKFVLLETLKTTREKTVEQHKQFVCVRCGGNHFIVCDVFARCMTCGLLYVEETIRVPEVVSISKKNLRHLQECYKK
ncbi:MAG: hypothetical protein ACTSYG_07275 [Candidatus Heimdallarchaeota archaeon]|nr:MAG: hypothetical protein DRP02_14595 [Candidatus Gerdarchaeota archaeon]